MANKVAHLESSMAIVITVPSSDDR